MSMETANPGGRCGGAALLIWGAVLLLSGLGLGVGGTLWLHHPPRPGPRAGPRDADVPDFRPEPIVEQMTRDLGLSDDQEKKVTAVYAQSLSAIKGLRQDMMVRLSAEHEKLRDALKQILTPLQFAQWDQRYTQMRARMMPGEPMGPPGGPRDRGGPGGPGGPGGGGPDGGPPPPPRGGPWGGGPPDGPPDRGDRPPPPPD